MTAYSDAFLTGHGKTAFDMLSTRCQERTNETEFVEEVAVAGTQYGRALDLASYDAHVSGDLARVTYTYAGAHEIDQDAEPWVFERGTWREDDC